MARCRCQEVECACRITNGENISITGDGTSLSPWVITGLPATTGTLQVADTPSLMLLLAGNGSTTSPYVISGEAQIGGVLTVEDTASVDLELTGGGSTASPMLLKANVAFVDLLAPGNEGDVLTLRVDGKYVPAPVSAAPGTIFAEGGIAGDGSFADPLHIEPQVYPSMAALDASLLDDGSLATVAGLGLFIKGTDGIWRAVDNPAGTIQATIATVADPGWALMDGQTLLNAQTLYPRLWALAPASWKAGANITLPTMTNRIPMGFGTTALGSIGGANALTLALAMLPAHSHAIDHDHPPVSTGFVSNDHQHDYSGVTGTENQQHVHNLAGGGAPFTNAVPGASPIIVGQADGFTGPEQQNHTHNFSGRTGGITANHNHSVDLPPFAGASGQAGGGQQVSVVQSHLAVNWQIRTY